MLLNKHPLGKQKTTTREKYKNVWYVFFSFLVRSTIQTPSKTGIIDIHHATSVMRAQGGEELRGSTTLANVLQRTKILLVI
jgi:hypothetical protein